MDPNLFHLNYERLFEVLFTIVVLSFFIERALALLFETKAFIKIYEANPKRKGLKELIAFIVSVFVCVYWKIDALSIIVVSHDAMQIPGYIITGAIIAGGAKGSMKLFKDLMGFKSSAESDRLKAKEKKAGR